MNYNELIQALPFNEGFIMIGLMLVVAGHTTATRRGNQDAKAWRKSHPRMADTIDRGAARSGGGVFWLTKNEVNARGPFKVFAGVIMMIGGFLMLIAVACGDVILMGGLP